jgi:hypothetical protein
LNAETPITFERNLNSSKNAAAVCGSGGRSETRDANLAKRNPITNTSNPHTQTISIDLSTDETSNNAGSPRPSPVHLYQASRDQHTGATNKSRDVPSLDRTKPSVKESDKAVVQPEIKKRRGRPPGSKNKKTLAKIMSVENGVNSKKETPTKEEESKDSEENDSKSPNSTISQKVESPILRPTEEEFKDPIKYLKSVQSTLKKFGICIIDPPESWKVSELKTQHKN